MERSTPLVSERIVKQLNAWCGLHGLMYTDGHINWTPAPLSLLPVPFSRKPFNYAQNIQPTWNKLIDRISRDREFITKELSSVSNADDFTSRLVKLYATVPADVLSTAVQFGVLRSDYMVNHDDHLLQVEINTISSSFGCLSRKVHLFHNYLLDRNSGDNEMKELVEKVTDVHKTPEELKNAIVENASLQKIAASIAAAHTVYGNKDAVVLFIVQPNERNVRI
jgi:glutathione synthase